MIRKVYPDGDDTEGLPLFEAIADSIPDSTRPGTHLVPFREFGGCDATVQPVAKLEAGNSFDALVKQFEGVEYHPDPIREVIAASPLTVEQADALRRGESLPKVRLIDGKVRGSEEEPRLSAQCAAILKKLREGPATNKELAAISLKYTGRISDLRQSGYHVEVASRDRKTGVTIYKLTEKP